MAVAALMRRLRYGQWRHFQYAAWVYAHGLDLSHESLEAIGLDADRSNHHHSSGGPDLAAVLRIVAPPAGSRVIDFGSGKGGACFTLEAWPAFVEVVGVELSAALLATAKQNAERLKSKSVFYGMDATAFTDLDRFTHAYMYNPFPAPIVRRVIANIADSLQRRPRRLTLIYQYPHTGDVRGRIDASLFPTIVAIRQPLAHPFHICVHG
jgi:SAM-dependent methyltransferase